MPSLGRRATSLVAPLIVIVTATAAAVAAVAACTSFASEDDPHVDPADARSDERGAQVDGAPGADASDAGDGAAPQLVGCSDGTREGFVDAATIAACQGAWKIGGLVVGAKPTCARAAGNDGLNKSGDGCGAEDLCALTWHVCRDSTDVATNGGTDPAEICGNLGNDAGTTFFATAQASEGGAMCSATGAGFDDVYGCGDLPDNYRTNCGPLHCVIGTFQTLPPFDVGVGNDRERVNVTKLPGNGGVLCCAD